MKALQGLFDDCSGKLLRFLFVYDPSQIFGSVTISARNKQPEKAA